MTENEEQYVAALLKQIEVLKEHVELLKKYPMPKEANNE